MTGSVDMTALEDRLRGALAAKADGITPSMLAEVRPPVDGEVLSLPAPAPHRPRRAVAIAMAVAAMVLVAIGAAAVRQATTSSGLDPAHPRPRSAVPWNQVGPGWQIGVLASHGRTTSPSTVYLVDPTGVWYRIRTLGENDAPGGWSSWRYTGVVYLMQHDVGGPTRILRLDLHSGAIRTVVIQGAWTSVQPVDPSGHTLLIDQPYSTMMTIDSHGRPLAHFEGTFFLGGRLSADGSRVAAGEETSLNIYDTASGALLESFAAPTGYNYCVPRYWHSATTVVALCQQRTRQSPQRLFAFESGGRVDAVTAPPPPGVAELHLYPDSAGSVKHEALIKFPSPPAGGRPSTFSVPAPLRQGDWDIYCSLDGSMLTQEIPATDLDPYAQADAFAAANNRWLRWYPATGRVVDLTVNRPPGTDVAALIEWEPPQH